MAKYRRKILLLGLLFFTNSVLVKGQISPNFKNNTYGFLENKGQIFKQDGKTNYAVKYLLTSPGFNVQLRNTGFSYDTYEILHSQEPMPKHDLVSGRVSTGMGSTVYKFHRVDIELLGSNLTPEITETEKSSSFTIFYSPQNSLPIRAYNYKIITYKNIYRGIDLVFDSRNLDGEPGFEYYFIIKPGANPNQIKLKYSGAETDLKANKINIKVNKGLIEEKIPASFLCTKNLSSLDDLKNSSPITVAYKKIEYGTYKFSIPKYDKSKTLVIDPTPDLVWGTYYGGSLNDLAFCIARDPSGNILVGGISDNPNLATAGAYQTIFAGNGDAMIGKFQSNGNLLWMTYYGGNQSESVLSICSDNSGNIYFGGLSDSKTGVATAGSHQPVHGDAGVGRDGFLVKFDGAGNRIWGTYYGGADVDYIHSIKVDENGDIFFVGWTHSVNGIATSGSYQPVYASGPSPTDQGDGFIARFDNNGTRIWGTYYGGQSFDRFYSLAFDNSSNMYISGVTNSPGMASAGAHQTNSGGGINDALLVKFNKNGSRVWATYYGGNNEDYSQAVTCDNLNNAIIGGMTISTGNIATTGTYLPVFAGGTRDAFVAKFAPGGSRIWGTYYGGNGEETIQGLTADQSNNIIIAGSSYSQNNIATASSYQPTFSGSGAIWTPFFAKLDAAGSRLWGTYYGNGSFFGNGDGEAVVTDNSGNVFVCGRTQAPAKIASCNALQQTWAGNQDMFVGMFSETITVGTVSVSITANPIGAVCSSIPVSFTAAPVNGGTSPSFQWKVNGINVGTNNPVFTSSTLNNGDQVTCTVTSNSACVTNPVGNSNTITITISPSVIPAINISSNMNGPICTGTSVTFTATPTNGGSSPSYQWKVNGNNVGTNSNTFVTSTLANGDLVTCVLTNPFSCNPVTTAISNIITANVVSTIIPSITITATTSSACSGTPVNFSAAALNAGINPTYQWKVNGNPVGAGLTYSTPTLSSNDIVECFLTPDGSACISSGSIGSNKLSIQIHPLSDFSILPSNTTISKGDTLQLSVTGESNVLSYKWTPPVNINNDMISNPLVWPAATQTYFLTTTSSQGCIRTKQVRISVISEVWIPNAFSPNNDGLNDTWGIKGLELYSGCQVSIFNRYGKLVYQSIGYSKPWDGKYSDQKILPGTYVYLIDLKNGLNPLTGTVTIIR
jgi:gliding motility-associated-like protein